MAFKRSGVRAPYPPLLKPAVTISYGGLFFWLELLALQRGESPLLNLGKLDILGRVGTANPSVGLAVEDVALEHVQPR